MNFISERITETAYAWEIYDICIIFAKRYTYGKFTCTGNN